MNAVDAYAESVVAGTVPAGKYHRLACARHLKDLQRQGTPGFPYHFDIKQADRFFRFAGKMKHYKGEWAGRFFEPSDFQLFIHGNIFGWRHAETGLRRFTTAYIEVPRKQGKSFTASVVAIYVTFYEGEPGAEGYCLATKEKQATDVVFRDIKQLIASSGLKDRLRVQVKNVHHDATMSKLEPLGSDSETLDGLNPHSITTDELHAFKTRALLDVMETATGARRNPLHYQITTAGNDLVSVCGDQHTYATKILEGVFEDESTDSFFACIAHADEDDDWLAESTWRKANPHYGISVKPDDLMKLALKAKHMPSAAAEFKQKRLGLWVNASAPCLSMEGWRKGQSYGPREQFMAALEHESCYVGIDLASKIDLCSMSLVFPPSPGRPKFCLIQYIWTPEDTLVERAHRDRAPYDVWVEQGWLLTAPGTAVDYNVIRRALSEVRKRYDIELIGFDGWHADQISSDLVNQDGFSAEQVVEIPQNFKGLTASETRFKEEVLAGNVDANGCPVTAWAASNVVEQTDGPTNILFVKKKSRGRIDPIKSATIAMAGWIKQPPAPKYEVFIVGGRV